jgi:hypothetical protein
MHFLDVAKATMGGEIFLIFEIGRRSFAECLCVSQLQSIQQLQLTRRFLFSFGQ